MHSGNVLASSNVYVAPASEDFLYERRRHAFQRLPSLSLIDPRSIASAVLPASPPPLLPSITIKRFLAQLDVDRIVRFAEPAAERVAVAHARLVAARFHPGAEVIGAHPARVQPAEQTHELLGVGLSRGVGSFGVVGGEGVQQSPGRASQLFDVGRAIRRRLTRRRSARRDLSGRRRLRSGTLGQRGPSADVGAGPTAAFSISRRLFQMSCMNFRLTACHPGPGRRLWEEASAGLAVVTFAPLRASAAASHPAVEVACRSPSLSNKRIARGWESRVA